MNLRAITIQDFMSWGGTQTVQFRPGLTVVEGNNTDTLEASSNGAGKSSLLYAICWALWGRVPPGGIKNSVIHHGSDQARVQLDLDGDVAIRILRTKPVNGSEKLEFWYGNVHRGKDETASDVQLALEKYYGISWDIFCNTVYIGDTSDTVRFMRARPSERAQLLGTFVQDDVFQVAADRAGVELKSLESETQNLLGQMAAVQATVQKSIQDVERLNGLITQEELNEAERTKLVSKQLGEVETEILNLGRVLKTTFPKDLNALQAEYNELCSIHDQNLQRLMQAQYILKQAPLGVSCLECGQLIGQEAHQRQQEARGQAQVEASMLSRAILEGNMARSSIESEIQKVKAFAHTKWETEQKINTLRIQAAHIKGQLKSNTIGYLLQERELAAQRTQYYVAEQNALQTKVGIIQQKVPILKVIQHGFRTEIRNMLLDELRTTLAYYAEQYRYLLAGNEFSITFPPTTEGGKEKFEIVILTGNQVNPLTSGGETDRAQLAILLALRKTLLHGKRSPFGFLLVDDPIGKLDESGARAFFELLSHLTGDFHTVLVTVPRPILGVRGEFTTMRITRRSRNSTLEEVQ